MKSYKIPVEWKVSGIMNIKANSFVEARELAYEGDLPRGNMVDDSFDIDEEYIRELNPEEYGCKE